MVQARFATLLVLAVLAVLAATRPDEASFHRAIQTHAEHEGGVIWGLFSRGSAYLAGKAGLLRYDDYGLFSMVTLERRPRPFRTLGILNQWVDVTDVPIAELAAAVPTLEDASDWIYDLQRSCPYCERGVCVPRSLFPPVGQCLCLPSWTGARCQRTIPGFQSVWAGWIHPLLSRMASIYAPLHEAYKEWARTSAVLGIPLTWLPAPLAGWFKHAGLVNVTRYIGLLDVLVAGMVGVYVMWVLPGALSLVSFWLPALSSIQYWLEEFMARHFTASWRGSVLEPLGWHTLIATQFSHRGLLSLAVNLYGLAVYGPSVYAIVGDADFGKLLAATMVGSIAGSFAFLWLAYGRGTGARGSDGDSWKYLRVQGANGWVFGLRAFSVMLPYLDLAPSYHDGHGRGAGRGVGGGSRRRSGGRGLGGFGVTTVDVGDAWAHLGPQLVADAVLGGDIGADVGGLAGAAVCALILQYKT